MEEPHPFKRSNINHFPRFSRIFDDAGVDEEEGEMDMSIDLVATLRGDQLDPTTTTKHDGQDWDVQEEAQCSDFFRDERRMELLKTPLNRRKSKEDEMMNLLRNLSERVSAIEKHLRIQEPDEKIPNSPKIQKSPVMRRRKYTPSASSRKQQQFGLSPIPSMLGSPARRRGQTNIAKTPVAPWLTPKNPTTPWSTSYNKKSTNNTATTRLDFEDEEEEDEDMSMLDMMDLKVSAPKSSQHSPIKRDAQYWRERLGSSLPPPDTASVLRRSQSFRRSWG